MKKIMWGALFLPTIIVAQVPPPPSERAPYIMESAPAMPKLSKEDTYIRTSNGQSQLMKGDNTPLSDFYDFIDYVASDFGKTDKIYIAKKGKNFGLLNKLGQPIGAFDFEKLTKTNDNNILAQKKGLWGVINNKGEVLVPFNFNSILYYNNQTNQLLASKNDATNKIYSGTKEQKIDVEKSAFTKMGVLYQKDGKWNILNGQDKNILPQSYDQIKVMGYANQELIISGTKVKYIQTVHPYFLVKTNNQFGLIDEHGKTVVPVQYDDIAYDTSRTLYNLKKGKTVGLYIPGEKPVMIDAVYNALYPSHNNTIVAIKDSKYGLLSKQGDVLLPFQYDSMMEYNTNKFLVKQNNKEGMVDGKGKILIPIDNDDISSFGGFNFTDYYTIKKDNLYGITKTDGQIILPTKYDWIGDYDDIIIAEKNKKWTLFDRIGFQIYPESIDYLARNFGRNNVYYMIKNKRLGLINAQGKILAKPIYKDFDFLPDENNLRNPFYSRYLLVTDENNKQGLFDERAEKFRIQPIYDHLKQTDGQNIIAKKGTKYGIIDDSNRTIIPFEYDDLSLDFIDTKNETFVAKKNNKCGLINAKNEVKIPFEYQNLVKISPENLYKANKGKGFLLINSDNKVLNAGPFEDILNFENNEALAFQNGKMVVLSADGKLKNTTITAKKPDGYKTFNELKFSLVQALDSKDDSLLKEFCRKIAPNPAMLYYLKKNIYDNSSTDFVDTNSITEIYFKELSRFKHQYWQTQEFKRESLIDNKDFEVQDRGRVVSLRDGLINDYREEILNNILKESIKINGYWYSSYFMKNRFGRY